ncbi:MAG: outer membrane beta-barrel protein, partial [Bdellovibrionales bacterium]
LEPYLGYSKGDIDYKVADDLPLIGGPAFGGEIAGLSYGARLGWMFKPFFIAGEYQVTKGKQKLDTAATDTDWTNTTTYGILGLQLDMGFRIYGGVSINHESVDEAEGGGETTYTGSAKKLGLGYRFSAPIALNAEYIMYDFDKYKTTGSSSVNRSEVYSKMDYNAVMLNLSFPFEVDGGR